MKRVVAILAAGVLGATGCATTGDGGTPRAQAAAPRNAPPAKKERPPVPPATVARLEADLARIPAGTLPSKWEHHVKQPPVPVHGFLLARHEVTLRDWAEVMGESLGDDDPALPVANVSWDEAHAFLDRLNAAKGAPLFRLPTAQEWELGCRGGAKGKVPMQASEATLSQYAWWGKNSGGHAHPVGTRKPNAFGLYDIIGNVAEWCETAIDPKEGTGMRVNAGDHFDELNSVGDDCRTASYLAQDGRERWTGFRLAQTEPPHPAR